MAPPLGDMLPAAPEGRRYRPRFPPRRLGGRQETAEVEGELPPVNEAVSSASEDEAVDSGLDSGIDSGVDSGVESDSEDDEQLSPSAPSSTPTPSAQSTGSALTTFRVGNGGVVATSLPTNTADIEPPLNVAVPDTVTASASETTVTESGSTTSTTSTTSKTTVTASPVEATRAADKEFGHHGDGHPEVMQEDDTKRHVMIGAGSIGAFIGVCVLTWLFWRVAKARKRKHANGSSLWPGRRPSISRQAQIGKLLGRIPWVKSQPWALRWQTLGDDDAVPITREKPDRSSSHGSYAAPSQRDSTGTVRPASLQRVVVSQLDTNLNFDPAAQSASPEVSPLSAATAVPSAAVVASHHQPQASFGSLDNQGGTWVYVSPTQTQAQRNYRNSELSSLSSGFGDGEMIIPAAYQAAPVANTTGEAPQAPPSTRARSSVGNRDTMCTATSEDQPARFRTISSWVDQQTGRIHRAQQRVKDGVVAVPGGDEGVPPVPGVPAGAGQNGLPPEPVFNMMMPDGEVPRRVEER